MLSAPVIYYARAAPPSLDPLRLSANIYVANVTERRGRGRYTAIGVHGVGRVLDRFVESSADLDEVLLNPSVDIPSLGNAIRGVLNLYIWDRLNESVFLLPDPLAGGLVYRHADRDGTAWSSDLHGLVGFLKSLGKAPKKSLNYLASILATGSGGLIPSSYENIDVLEQFEYLEVDALGARRHEYSSVRSVFGGELRGEAATENTVQEIRDNVEVAVNAGHHTKTAHLTGGFDSRLVLAALMANGTEDQVRFFCSGSRELPDRMIAENLSSELSLTMTEHPGGEATIYPREFKDHFLQPMRYAAGMLAGQIDGPMTSPVGGSLVLSGGYGERLRSVYTPNLLRHIGAPVEGLAGELWGSGAFSSESVLNESIRRRLLEALSAILSKGEQLGVRPDAQLDYLFLSVRNRYYVGQVTRLWSTDVSRFDPLYTLSGPAEALAMDVRSRAANLLGFDVMARLQAALAEFPFDTPRHSEDYIHLRGTPKTRGFTAGSAPTYDGRKVRAASGTESVGYPRPTNEDLKKAKQLRASPRQVAALNPVRAQCKEMLSGIGRTRLEETFNYSILMRLMNSDLKNRVHIRTVFNLYASLLWYYEQD